MKHFVSVIFRNQLTESKRDIVQDTVINTAKVGLLKSNTSYEIFESEKNTQVLRLPLKKSIPENLQKRFVEALANRLFDKGHSDFEIELSIINEATLRRGSRGPEVQALQQQLGVPADGIFGPQTEQAVRAFQQRAGIQVDGIAGGQTQSALASGGAPRNAGTARPSTAPFQPGQGSTTQAPPAPTTAAPQTSPRPQARPAAAPTTAAPQTSNRPDPNDPRGNQIAPRGAALAAPAAPAAPTAPAAPAATGQTARDVFNQIRDLRNAQPQGDAERTRLSNLMNQINVSSTSPEDAAQILAQATNPPAAAPAAPAAAPAPSVRRTPPARPRGAASAGTPPATPAAPPAAPPAPPAASVAAQASADAGTLDPEQNVFLAPEVTGQTSSNVTPRPTGSGRNVRGSQQAWDRRYRATHNPDGTPKNESVMPRPKGAFLFRERAEWDKQYGSTHNSDGTKKSRRAFFESRNMQEETYNGDEFFETYGVMWFNEDEELDEAEYQGRTVKLGKPMRGDVKKFKVYVKNPKGNVVKVNFGDPDMKIKKSNPARRRSFRARHNCDNPGPRHKARYWSCRKW